MSPCSSCEIVFALNSVGSSDLLLCVGRDCQNRLTPLLCVEKSSLHANYNDIHSQTEFIGTKISACSYHSRGTD